MVFFTCERRSVYHKGIKEKRVFPGYPAGVSVEKILERHAIA